ncbi:UDP-glucose/GDP-mannose dehydrogenase family protein [Microbacterium sp. YMB-B2]|uniref:UDP-glucose 6-dehydrogenase n=1 Tax=Microbacterium tenebrionis TaxID=2830665 RepID=A0A9X1S111_9MICO|nr:UDP-glucose/GDP-mannose dehydrogenase family protein [Microbacterium tenebrionis]MCC2029353.1 UDP-glucose/GDP-mannose dehydrogenase family protein [Microbacterium tenebrionis]
MKLSVIGCGYLGAVHATAMASIGHEVVGIDVDPDRIALLSAGKAPFYEPGFDDLLRETISTGRLRFTTDPSELETATVHFLAVGTPQRQNEDSADLRYIDAAVESLLPNLAEHSLVVGKSTVPVGTAQRLASIIEQTGARLAWNPEFLREGFAVQDTLEPDRIVYGVSHPDGAEVELLDRVYAPTLALGVPRLIMDYATAELVKVAANAFLATKISFINAMAEIADATGADVSQLADAIGHDARIGRRFLNAGLGFGGGCLPKDIRAFAARGEELGHGASLRFLREVDEINLRQRTRLIETISEHLDSSVVGRRIAILGLAFKPNSDDTRDSPALEVATRLHAMGAEVICYDPEAITTARAARPHLNFADSIESALTGADITVIATEWDQFRTLDPAAVSDLVGQRIVIDGRNCLDPALWRAGGWTYRGLGRR